MIREQQESIKTVKQNAREPKQWAQRCYKTPQSWEELQSQVITLCGSLCLWATPPSHTLPVVLPHRCFHLVLFLGPRRRTLWVCRDRVWLTAFLTLRLYLFRQKTSTFIIIIGVSYCERFLAHCHDLHTCAFLLGQVLWEKKILLEKMEKLYPCVFCRSSIFFFSVTGQRGVFMNMFLYFLPLVVYVVCRVFSSFRHLPNCSRANRPSDCIILSESVSRHDIKKYTTS